MSMMLLQVQQLTKYFGAELILSNIKLEMQTRDRIALVGRNGAGKSTLLKIIAGELAADSGDIIKPKDVSIGYLPQNTGLESQLTIWEEMMTVFDNLRDMEKNVRSLEKRMADPSIYEKQDQYEKLMKEYDFLQTKFKEIGGYQYEADTRSVLHGMRFYEQDYDKVITHLSGGQKTRLALAKLLLTKPDVLILDEPTNHLDIETLSWLEQYLQNNDCAILVVSHDRYFLDKIVNQVYELSRQSMTKYKGNYSKYLVQKAERLEQELKKYEKQQDEIAKLQDFVQKNIARASTTKRAQSRRKQLARMEILERPNGEEHTASMMFGIKRETGNDVLHINDGVIGYHDTALVKNLNLSIQKRESIALVGPNGIGKTTLLKTVMKKLPLLAGDVRYGANLLIGYYDQEQATLTSNKTVLAELWDEYPTKSEKEIRTMLGHFLFSQDDVDKHVSTLSGGEKARLSLAKLAMQDANFLILDEPTNHLDLDSKEILEHALINYPGTILFVSHDRYFINHVATKVIELTSTGANIYLGDYDYYIEKKQEAIELAAFEQQHVQKAKEQTNKQSYHLNKEAQKLERQRKRRLQEIEITIEALEQELQEKEMSLADPEVYQQHETFQKVSEEIEDMNSQLEQLMEEWAELEE